MKSIRLWAALLSGSLLSAAGHAAGPHAAARSHAQNYKDMVLASCLAQAYRHDPGAAADAGSSIAALRDWTEYDLERSPDAVKALVDSYLARDYSHPLVESEIPGIRFDFLKCMDLYHSKALDELARRLVIHPKQTAR
jgi:hypothetical protein